MTFVRSGGPGVLNALGLPPLPWVTIAVGLHLLPLARMWRAPILVRAGAVLALPGVPGPGGRGAPRVFMLGGLLWGAARPARVAAA